MGSLDMGLMEKRNRECFLRLSIGERGKFP